MERNEFLSKLGIGVLAVCTGCAVASCGGNSAKEGDPVPNPNPPNPGTGPLFSADLASEITAVGSSKTSNGVILVRIAPGNVATSFTAVQLACTHEGTSINYSNAESIFICPNHGSRFSQTGSVVLGPAATALRRYTVNVTGTALTVVA